MSDAMTLLYVLSIVSVFIAFFISADLARRKARSKMKIAFLMFLFLSGILLLSFGLVFGYEVGYRSQIKSEYDFIHNLYKK